MITRSLVVVSGGAESVGASIVAWAHALGSKVHVFSLSPRSLLSGLPGVVSLEAVDITEPRTVVLDRLCAWLVRLIDCEGAHVFAYPTEDDSLGLLLDARRSVPRIHMSRCIALDHGGLDKAELFEALEARGLSRWLAPTRAVSSWDDVDAALFAFGRDMIIKPASKPWSRNLAGGSKLFLASEFGSPIVRRELEEGWSGGHKWVAQPRLLPLEGSERSACLVRGGGIHYAEVVEMSKYPARGGSACWVRTQPRGSRLREAATAIADAVDLIGIAELSFLADRSGQPRLLELNARPWLQMELLQHAGFDLLTDSIAALDGDVLPNRLMDIHAADWVSLERMALKFLHGDGSRMETLRDTIRASRQQPVFSIWSNNLPGLRQRWASRMLRRMFSKAG